MKIIKREIRMQRETRDCDGTTMILILAKINVPFRLGYLFSMYGIYDILYQTDKVIHISRSEEAVRLVEAYQKMATKIGSNSLDFYQAIQILHQIVQSIYVNSAVDLTAFEYEHDDSVAEVIILR